jgi:hypothetical protein
MDEENQEQEQEEGYKKRGILVMCRRVIKKKTKICNSTSTKPLSNTTLVILDFLVFPFSTL